MNDQQRAAMQMALEALEGINKMADYEGNTIWLDEEITALREALGLPIVTEFGVSCTASLKDEDTRGLMYVADVDMPDGFRPYKERIAELEQDPEKKAALDRARERVANTATIRSMK